ncbi:MAG: hypothetical protein JKY45_10495 [Emcibacter sp.]|nr:hypothetical protein [Emcibacter sp.]
MTEMNKDDAQKEAARMKRRSLLKAGAAIVPLAVTLHGGAAFAHVSSAGRCVSNLTDNLMIPQFKKKHNGTYKKIGMTNFKPSMADMTGRKINGIPEDHWNYVLREKMSGQTCLQSFMQSGEDRNAL